MELSELQKSIIESPSNRSVVIASAASGKTRLLTEKVRQLLRAGVDPRQIAVITFTNMAAGELRQRLGEDYKEGLFVGTVHSLANFMLSMGGIDTKKIIDSEEFDKFFVLLKEHPTCIRHLEWVLLDEAQDSDESQFDFLFDMIQPDYFFVVGDEKQAIYKWRGSNSELMQRLVDRYGAKLFNLNENYRNGYNILSFAKRIIKPTKKEDTSVTKQRYNGVVREMPYSTKTIIDAIETERDYGNWAILTRSNKEIFYISAALRKQGIPVDTFKQGDLSKEELTQKMEQDTVKVLTVHSAKGLEWDKVIVVGMKFYSDDERNVGYVAATRAKRLLIWMTSAAKKAERLEKWG